MNYGFNPALNQPSMWQWPEHEREMFKRTVSSNHEREKKLTPEQAKAYEWMTDFWLRQALHYDYITNYNGPLCDALACQDVLDAITKTAKEGDDK